jgi:hypothetical protein
MLSASFDFRPARGKVRILKLGSSLNRLNAFAKSRWSYETLRLRVGEIDFLTEFLLDRDRLIKIIPDQAHLVYCVTAPAL